jgi:hypothetical protein
MAGKFPTNEVYNRLHQTGISPGETEDYIDQIERLLHKRVTNQRSGRERSPEGRRARPRESSPSGHAGKEREGRTDQQESDAAAWGVLRSKLQSFQSHLSTGNESQIDPFASLLALSGPSTSSGTFSSSLLAAAPNLAELKPSSSSNDSRMQLLGLSVVISYKTPMSILRSFPPRWILDVINKTGSNSSMVDFLLSRKIKRSLNGLLNTKLIGGLLLTVPRSYKATAKLL